MEFCGEDGNKVSVPLRTRRSPHFPVRFANILVYGLVLIVGKQDKKTVVILGAGASYPYSFPLGTELKDRVVRWVDSPAVLNRLGELAHDSQHLDELRECLNFGRFQTIDQFLELKKRFRKVGGQIIAECILSCENPRNIFPARDWMAVMYAKLHQKALEGEPNHLTFVTLNYDRSLEFFLSKISRIECDEVDEEKVHQYLSEIPILHPHGSLGTLFELPFAFGGGEINAPVISQAGERIQIISDKLEESPAFVEAQKVLSEADRIFSVGFAYHPSTLNTLLKHVDIQKTDLIGTAMNLSPTRTQEVMMWSDSKITLHPMSADAFFEKQIEF